MRAFCITLRESPERREAARKHFEGVGLPVTFWDGCHGKTFGLRTDHLNEHGLEMAQGHLGNWVSHWSLWNHLSHIEGDEFLIFEDDVVLPDDFQAKLAEAMKALPDDWQFVFVGQCCVEKKTPRVINALVSEFKYPLCCHAYLVRRSALDVLLATNQRAWTHIDIQLERQSLPHLRQYSITPPLAQQMSIEGHCKSDASTGAISGDSIPKIIHQAWVGPKPRPVEWMASWQRMAAKHGWSYRFYSEADLDATPMQNKSVYNEWKAQGRWHGMANVARFELLKRFGGLWVDCDFVSSGADPSDFIDFRSTQFACTTEHHIQEDVIKSMAKRNLPGAVRKAFLPCIGFMASQPRGAIVSEVLNQMRWHYDNNPGQHSAVRCGCFLLHNCLVGPVTYFPMEWIFSNNILASYNG